MTVTTTDLVHLRGILQPTAATPRPAIIILKTDIHVAGVGSFIGTGALDFGPVAFTTKPVFSSSVETNGIVTSFVAAIQPDKWILDSNSYYTGVSVDLRMFVGNGQVQPVFSVVYCTFIGEANVSDA